MFIQLVPYLSLAIFGLPTTAFHSSSSAPSSAEAELIARFYPAEPICRGPRAVVNLQSTGLAWMEFRGFLMARLQQQQEELDQGDEILPADGSHLASIVRSFVVGLEGLPQRTGDERVGLPLAWASDSCGITIDITPDAESERASIDDIDAAVQAIRNTCVKPTLYMDFKGQLGTGGMTTTGEDQKLRVSIYGVSKELVGEQPVLTDTSIPGFDGMTLGEQGSEPIGSMNKWLSGILTCGASFCREAAECCGAICAMVPTPERNILTQVFGTDKLNQYGICV